MSRGQHLDDFNYPVARRPTTNWTLGSDAVASRSKLLHSISTKTTNRTDDIQGAASGTTEMYRAKHFCTNKPVLHNPIDIEGAQPRRHVKAEIHRTTDFALNNRDIEHSYPESKLFTTPRVVNPMNPDYPLPKVVHRAPTPPRHLTETNKIEDIEGSRPCKKGITRQHPLNPVDYSDVAHPKPKVRTTPGLSLTTKDISGTAFVSQRPEQNPLDPKYRIFGVDVGGIPGSHPKRIRSLRNGSTDNSLQTADIEGARNGNSDHVPYPKNRREWKQTCDVSDIKAMYPTKMSTFHKDTNRGTDPVNPAYRMPAD